MTLARAYQLAKAGDAAGVLEALEGVQPGGDDVTSIRIEFARERAYEWLRRLDESTRSLLATAEAAEKVGWLRSASRALYLAGLNAYRGAAFLAAARRWTRRLDLDRKLGDLGATASDHDNIGLAYTDLGRFEEALEHQRRALEIFGEIGDLGGVARTLDHIGVVHCHRGEFDQGLEHMTRALRIREDQKDRRGVAMALARVYRTERTNGCNMASSPELDPRGCMT